MGQNKTHNQNMGQKKKKKKTHTHNSSFKHQTIQVKLEEASIHVW
jgi:hypothetical protein